MPAPRVGLTGPHSLGKLRRLDLPRPRRPRDDSMVGVIAEEDMREEIVPLASALLALGLATVPVRGESTEVWPAFRGADARAVAADNPRLPESWSTTENVVWESCTPPSRASNVKRSPGASPR